jgi:hypothetical protein
MKDSLSTLRGLMKQNHSEKELIKLIDEITQSNLVLKSASNDENGAGELELIDVTTKSELAVAYGRLVIEFSEILRMFTLKCLYQITKSDYNHLMGDKTSGTVHDFSLNYDSEAINKINQQIKQIQNLNW